MTQTTNEPSQIETTVLDARVQLTVAPRTGQSLEDAAAEMLRLFTDYVSRPDSAFLQDYGANLLAITRHRADPSNPAPSWGGYEGPFVIRSGVSVSAG
ncbi:hypothetical protein SAMN06295974_3872 [Plantibacter flavus]|uniref:Uncharacterized protein n=1 Tax=Plantibacter flavus TaxID=150123 RepID=A0A3N2BL24_9MICO|nr:hypothetical protein [Plantibacter flavus]ROR75983.1 hypothetical protein EDD42_3934 [Plantibacter flavus]SMG49619.1 hypothetical protein SAMN06295974_3872 [Plantibacter flavus]